MSEWLTIPQVSEQLEISKSTCYRYFEDFPDIIKHKKIKNINYIHSSALEAFLVIKKVFANNMQSAKQKRRDVYAMLAGESLNMWVIGFLWGSSRRAGDVWLVQNQRKNLVRRVRNEMDASTKIFTVTRHGGESYRLKLSLGNRYVSWMKEHGHTGRAGAIDRDIPAFESVDAEREFLRGYFACHYSYDAYSDGRLRIRFFAAHKILERLNYHLHEQIGTTIKKVHKHYQNEVCHILHYQSKIEVPKITEYMQLDIYKKRRRI